MINQVQKYSIPDSTVIEAGRIYTYTNEIPPGCSGKRYRVHRFILDVPTYQHKVLVEALEGDDKGLWFVCSISNFTTRYKLLEEKVEEANA